MQNPATDRRARTPLLGCLLISVLSIALVGRDVHAAELPAVEHYAGRITIQKDIPFSKDSQPHQKLDLYLPRGDGPFPVTVYGIGDAYRRRRS